MCAATLAGQVCLVTGASRGIGKGIAVQLAVKGAKVYITGRTLDAKKDSKVGGSLRETATEIEARGGGGSCIPVQCDHSKDDDVTQLFDQIERENEGQLDILVNNAFSAVNVLAENMGKKFWEMPFTVWDDVNNVALRNNYVCSVLAAKLMVPRKRGLIVNISSGGGIQYMYGVPYGVGKEACDRMAADCGLELRKHGVAYVSLWPGPVGTEELLLRLSEANDSSSKKIVGKAGQERFDFFNDAETPEFSGQCVAAMATDAKLMKKSGTIVWTCDLGREYGLTDDAGHTPLDYGQVKTLLQMAKYNKLAWFVPGFIRVPKWMVVIATHKFY